MSADVKSRQVAVQKGTAIELPKPQFLKAAQPTLKDVLTLYRDLVRQNKLDLVSPEEQSEKRPEEIKRLADLVSRAEAKVREFSNPK
jgi:hypothetical protein